MEQEQYNKSKNVVATGVLSAKPGYLDTLTLAGTTASITAGLLTIYDNATTNSGTVLWQGWIYASLQPVTLHLKTQVSAGIYAKFDATLANVSVTASFNDGSL